MSSGNKKRGSNRNIPAKASANPPTAKEPELADIPLEISPETLKKLKPREQAQLLSVITQYQGPIPHHEALAAYEGITPGLADRIVAMAERESENRHKIDQGNVELNDKHLNVVRQQNDDTTALNKRAQFFAFLICAGGIIGGIYLIISGYAKSGTTLMTLTIGTLAMAYLRRPPSENKNSDQ